MTAKLSLLLDHVKSEPVPEEAEAYWRGVVMGVMISIDHIRNHVELLHVLDGDK
jgi:hypothetical protein